MKTESNNQRGFWGSRLGFILAASGSAVGLGNVWKFPYIVGENGGGAFVLIYLICIFVIGTPIMLAEFTLGRKKGLPQGYEDIAESDRRPGGGQDEPQGWWAAGLTLMSPNPSPVPCWRLLPPKKREHFLRTL